MSRIPASEAEQLWRAWREHGDVAARDRLIAGHEQMVRYLAVRKLRDLPAHVELDDLVSCGMEALIRAVDRFDPAKGATFEQYAWTRVVGAIIDELRREDWMPRTRRQIVRRLDDVEQRLTAREGRPPSETELAAELRVSVADLRDFRADYHRGVIASLHMTAGTDADSTLEDLISDDADPYADADDRADQAELLSRILDAADTLLTERERLALFHEHGAGIEVAARLGISDSRVSQLRTSAAKKIREALAA